MPKRMAVPHFLLCSVMISVVPGDREKGNLQSRRVLAALQRMGWSISRAFGKPCGACKAWNAASRVAAGASAIRATTTLSALRRAGEDVSRFAKEY